MSDLVTKSGAPKQQAQQEQKIETRTAVKRIAGFTIGATAVAVLAVLVATALYGRGQNKSNNNDKYSLISPGGIAFSDFRGYEDWSVVSTARTDEVLKAIVANPAMIKAKRPGFRATGQLFPHV